MDSNKHATMEQNEEHIMLNIFTYHTYDTELQTWSYGMMNKGLKFNREKT